MACWSCGSSNSKKFESEISIHFPQIKDAHKRPVLVFPDLIVCLDCGEANFVVPQTELKRLAGD